MNEPFADSALPAHHMPQRDAVMLASVLHLMSHYTARDGQDKPCVRLASVIERHLCALSRLPDIDPVLRATCEQLAERWAAIVDERLPQPVKPPLLARFIRGRRLERQLVPG